MTITAPLSVRRDQHDGAHYEVSAVPPAITALSLHDADGDVVCLAFDRPGARQLIEDITLVAGLAPTRGTLGPAAALAGAFRRNFELLAELRRTDPAAADLIVASIAAHLRSSEPLALRGAAL